MRLIYPNEDFARRESKAVRAAQGSPVFPKLYKNGRKYNVIEYVAGTSLDEHFKKKGYISEHIVEQILFVLKELKRLRFTRRDARLRHLILTKEGKLKVIDHVNSLQKKYKRPTRMLEELDELGLRAVFLNQVKKRDPELYRKWKE